MSERFLAAHEAFMVSTWCRYGCRRAGAPDARHNEDMDSDREYRVHAPVWRDPLSAGWRAHRGLLLLRLRWHERRTQPSEPTNPS
ncbi:hypothetical protein AWC12_21060 [Mycolicibacterium iranicum]|uniref:Uncharacterized protein n=2 Tax=Mycolicibacterium iranicum TaxID=912594 RepID=A0A1X1WEW7_MYCIR|nr:hypothetical protein AWC12_21060 [Mycolicibacterium iranicum]